MVLILFIFLENTRLEKRWPNLCFSLCLDSLSLSAEWKYALRVKIVLDCKACFFLDAQFFLLRYIWAPQKMFGTAVACPVCKSENTASKGLPNWLRKIYGSDDFFISSRGCIRAKTVTTTSMPASSRVRWPTKTPRRPPGISRASTATWSSPN